MATVSVIILARNEEHNIHDCIESVQFADEVLVIDDFSTDDTVKISEEMGAPFPPGCNRCSQSGSASSDDTYIVNHTRLLISNENVLNTHSVLFPSGKNIILPPSDHGTSAMPLHKQPLRQ